MLIYSRSQRRCAMESRLLKMALAAGVVVLAGGLLLMLAAPFILVQAG